MRFIDQTHNYKDEIHNNYSLTFFFIIIIIFFSLLPTPGD